MTVREQAEVAVRGVIDRLAEAARTINGLTAETQEDGIAIAGARLKLRMIADPELRDLVDTVRR